ncbi:hypothetical protein ASZ90_019607 [hydrocarbon metagenome]|uniref:DUF1850 domain-containing protein n=1 Tax=hydrocarbon metagenome TaxID=938273 RepID=A0A0W8E3U2_9ZZZZ
MTRNHKWLVVSAAGIIILILLTASMIQIPALVISEQRGDELLIIPLLNGRDFDYQYIHSVQKTPVQEHFTAAPDNQLLLTSTTYQSFGVGLPFMPGEGTLEHIDGKYVLSGINRKFNHINIGFITLAHQELSYNGKCYSFQDHFVSGTILVVEVKQFSALEIMRKITRRIYSEGP